MMPAQTGKPNIRTGLSTYTATQSGMVSAIMVKVEYSTAPYLWSPQEIASLRMASASSYQRTSGWGALLGCRLEL